jgi:hypothetical protein
LVGCGVAVTVGDAVSVGVAVVDVVAGTDVDVDAGTVVTGVLADDGSSSPQPVRSATARRSDVPPASTARPPGTERADVPRRRMNLHLSSPDRRRRDVVASPDTRDSTVTQAAGRAGHGARRSR